MNTFDPQKINWEKVNGLLPVIIQHGGSGQVLMFGYMNHEALAKTLKTNQVTFYSRTKKRLWMKGESSGHILQVVNLALDCDQDTLLIYVSLQGPCCHLNQISCFGDQDAFNPILQQLEAVIKERYIQRPEQHYTTALFAQGIQRIAQKIGEEGVEVALAACFGNREEIISEVADLFYHLIVLLVAKQIEFKDLLTILLQRRK